MSLSLAKSNGMNAMDDNKSKALVAALAQIEKQFGKGSIMKMGEAQVQNDLQVVSTGSLGLDIALGVGGLPRGRVVEVYGPESSGKTTLCLQVVAQVQKAGGVAAYIDAENALDPVYAGKLGVNVGEMLISQPDTGEQGLEIAEQPEHRIDVERRERPGGAQAPSGKKDMRAEPFAGDQQEHDREHGGPPARAIERHALGG